MHHASIACTLRFEAFADGFRLCGIPEPQNVVNSLLQVLGSGVLRLFVCAHSLRGDKQSILLSLRAQSTCKALATLLKARERKLEAGRHETTCPPFSNASEDFHRLGIRKNIL